jgi:hypothetical protein
MRLQIPILLVCSLASRPSFSQVDSSADGERYYGSYRHFREKAVTLLVGGHLQYAKDEQEQDYTRKLLEVGVHRTISTSYAVVTHGPSVEVSLERKPLAGFKYGAWTNNYFFALGLNALYYTNFDEGSFRLRPEFGLGVYRVKLSVGYNMPVTNKSFYPLREAGAQVTLNWLFRLKTLKYEGPPGGRTGAARSKRTSTQQAP